MSKNLKELTKVLRSARREDRANLAEILAIKGNDSAQQLSERIHNLRSGILGQYFVNHDYKQLTTDVADHLDVDWEGLLHGRRWEQLTAAEIEDAIVIKAFQKLYESLSEPDRRKLAEELGRAANDPSLVGHILTGGAMTLAQLSGFQFYVLATTVVGALTSALGITLPFVIYTTLTRALGVALGPIGWILFGATVLFQLNRPNWSRLVPGIIYVSYIRHKRDAGDSN